MAASDAKPVPIKGVPHRIYFPIWNLTGLTVNASAAVTATYSQDAGAWDGATAAALPQNVGSKGTFYLDVPGSKMDCTALTIYVSCAVSGARPYVDVLYPATAAAFQVDVQRWAHTSVAVVGTAGCPKVEVVYVNDSSASRILACDVATWAHTSVAAITTAGAPSVNVVAWNSGSASGDGTPSVIVGSYATGMTPLQPTVAGRTVDVNANGEVGLDWGNIGNQTTAVNLTGTTVQTVTTVAAIADNGITSGSLAGNAVDEILDDTLEGSITVRQALRVILAAAAGKLSGAQTSQVIFRDQADTLNRITATVVSGNRTAITLDLS